MGLRLKALKLPVERLCHRAIEVPDEGSNLLLEILSESEVAAPNQSSGQNTKPTFNLIEPRGMFGHVDEANAMGWITQESRT
ncbi:hypothetical protein LBWT_55140 [Leptolyngbya boryana IAM M-101]|nr:hypothetical protein LBWT_55140 [Leptolyngbya boryana IAM M-101]BAS65890.1 hypothetical protein LBDG_55140 [Leptolyngbya boryana dg5]